MVNWRFSNLVEAQPFDANTYANERRIRLREFGLTIVFRQEAWADLRVHVDSSKVEVGGILIGEAFSDAASGQSVAEVLHAIPAQGALETPTYFQFTPLAWEAISQQREKLHPDLLTVGWYHSHPSLGVFYSSTDRASQRAFFNRPWNFGIVIDPSRNEHGVFLGGDSVRTDDAIVFFDSTFTLLLSFAPAVTATEAIGHVVSAKDLESVSTAGTVAQVARSIPFKWIAALGGIAATVAISLAIKKYKPDLNKSSDGA